MPDDAAAGAKRARSARLVAVLPPVGQGDSATPAKTGGMPPRVPVGALGAARGQEEVALHDGLLLLRAQVDDLLARVAA